MGDLVTETAVEGPPTSHEHAIHGDPGATISHVEGVTFEQRWHQLFGLGRAGIARQLAKQGGGPEMELAVVGVATGSFAELRLSTGFGQLEHALVPTGAFGQRCAEGAAKLGIIETLDCGCDAVGVELGLGDRGAQRGGLLRLCGHRGEGLGVSEALGHLAVGARRTGPQGRRQGQEEDEGGPDRVHVPPSIVSLVDTPHASTAVPPSGPAPRSRGRRLLGLAVRLGLTGLAVWLLLRQVDPREALSRVGDAPGWVLAVPALLLLFNSGIHALRLRILMGAAGPMPPLHRFHAAMLKASFFGLVLPTGGTELAKLGFLRPLVGRTDLPVAALLLARLLELLPWTALLLFGLAWGLPAHDPLLAGVAAVFAGIFIAVMALAVVAVRSGGRLAAILPGALGRFTHDIVAAFEQVRRQPQRLVSAGLLAVPFALINGFVVWVLVRAYALGMSYPDVLAVIPAADTLISLPVTVSGIGVREGVFVHVLAPWGADEATAVAVAVLRWTGELGRAAVGGLLFVAAGGRAGASGAAGDAARE